MDNMKVPITIVLDLNEYASDYSFEKGDFFRDVVKEVKKEYKDMIASTIKEDVLKIEVKNQINTLDFQLELRNFLENNKEEIINEVVKIVARKEEVLKNMRGMNIFDTK